MKKKHFTVLLLAILPLAAMAHPGHDQHHEQPIAHYLTSPVHYLPLAVIIISITYLVINRKKISDGVKNLRK